MRLIYAILFLTCFQAKADDYPLRQLLKFTIYPEFHSYRFQYELAPQKFYSFGGSAFYSPKGRWGNEDESFGISPMIRGYVGNSRAKGFYLECSLPITYSHNYSLNYGLLSKTHVIGNVYSHQYAERIEQSFTAIGGGLAVGGQFKLYRRLFMDIAMVYEKYMKPASIDKEIIRFENEGGNVYEKKYELDEAWNYLSMRIYFGYQLKRD